MFNWRRKQQQLLEGCPNCGRTIMNLDMLFVHWVNVRLSVCVCAVLCYSCL